MKNTGRILAFLVALCMALPVSALATEPLAEKYTADMSASEYATLTTFADRDCSGSIFLGHDVTGSADIVLNEEVEGPAYTAVYAHGEGVAADVSGVVIASDDTGGELVSDLAGQGTVIVASDGAAVNLHDARILTDGFERTALIVGDHSTVRVVDSELIARGANPLTEAYEGYEVGGARMDQQISPAWSLGIQGSSRTVNMVGDEPILTVIDSSITSGGWALISVEASTAMSINVVDSELAFLPDSEGGMDSGWRIFGYDEDAYGSGYGSFNFDYPAEYFYGTTIRGVTYGSVIMGSKTIHYGSSNGSLDLIDVNGELLESVEGKGQPTILNGVFGILHTGALQEGVYFEDGTVVHTGDAVILHKSGSGDFFFDNAELRSDKGVLFQMMDNDDDTRINRFGGDKTLYNEDNVASGIGFPGLNYECESRTGGYTVSAAYSNGVYDGSLYNGSGYYGHVGSNLVVTLGENAVLNGDIALTSTIKGVPYSAEAMEGIAYYGDDIGYILLDAEGRETDSEANAAFIQMRSYTINEYFLHGHVENLPYYNGVSTVEVVVEDGAEWNVSGQSLITKLTVADGASVKGTLTVNADGTLTLTAGDDIIPAGTYGTIEPVASAEMGGSGEASGSGETSDTSAGQPKDDMIAEAEARALPLEGVSNAWQLGGYTTGDGRTVRENALLRSGALTDATEEDIKTLSEVYHVTAIVDFRSPKETSQAPEPEIPGAEYVNISLEDAMKQSESMANMAEMMSVEMQFSDEPGRAAVEQIRMGLRSTNEDLYIEKITSDTIDAGIREFLDVLLAQEEGGVVLYHCKNGKDRTGTATMILLTLLGVDRETILEDFDLTNYFMADAINAEVEQASQYTDEEDVFNVVRVMAGVSKDFMAKAFDYAEEQSGSMLEYVKQRYQVTDEEIARLQELYLAD